MNQTKNIIIAVNPDKIVDSIKAQRIAWHEVSRWKDLLEGFPRFWVRKELYPMF